MRNVIFLTLFICTITKINAQEWTYDIDKAQEIATNENKLIVLVFSGSDWCAPCIKLERKIWESTEFQKLAKDSFILLKADFPRRKKNQLSEEQQKQNNLLAEKYNVEGNFPLVVVLDSAGKVKGKMGYKNLSPTQYYEQLKSF